uniref:BTB domain-containing protein n=1 Tax=Panagrolaimus sp. ES5 TaxID=591445 RepID=A0AC34FT65_9BILA
MSSTGDSKVYVRKSDELLQCLNTMQTERYKIFKEQDLEKGRFDVTFEVEGKMLHAHRFVLTSVSEPLDSWLSNRWTTKDAVIKIEDYPYDCFYEFLCFLYAGTCALSQENIAYKWAEHRVLKDKTAADDKSFNLLAAVKAELKNMVLPELDLSRMNYGFLMDFVVEKGFLLTPAELSQFFIYRSRRGCCLQHAFKNTYNVAEKQVLKKQEMYPEESFNLNDSINAYLVDVIPLVKFSIMDPEFLLDFVVENGFFLSPAEFSEAFLTQSFSFQDIYELAEKQALKKQEMYAEESFNLRDSISASLVDVMPNVKFSTMSFEVLMTFVFSNQIISKEQANQVSETLVEIKNDGKIITGVFKDVHRIRRYLESHVHRIRRFLESCHQRARNVKRQNISLIRFPQLKFPVPSTPSTVEKMKGVDWYFCLDDGVFAFKNYSAVRTDDYLIAEMKSAEEFQLVPGETTYLTVRFNNLK